MYYTQTYHLHGPSTLLERDILYTDTVISLSGDIVNGVRPDQEASFEVVTTQLDIYESCHNYLKRPSFGVSALLMMI